MKKNEREVKVKVKVIPLLCWDIYFDYLDTKIGIRKNDHLMAKQMKLK